MSNPQQKPLPIKLFPKNFFIEGWMHRVLELPKRQFDDVNLLVRDVDIDAYNEGYDMADETDERSYADALFGELSCKNCMAKSPYPHYEPRQSDLLKEDG